MQQYQPFSAVAGALEICKSVDVIHENGKIYLQRKEPFVKEQVTGEKPTKKKGKVRLLHSNHLDIITTLMVMLTGSSTNRV